MRQQSSQHSNPTQPAPCPKLNMQKKRQIRKTKLMSSIPPKSDLYNIDTSSLTRQEKHKLQKQKNREAAQKSRDTHKIYICSLEAEIKELRAMSQYPAQLCWRCKCLLEHQTHQHQQHQHQHKKGNEEFVMNQPVSPQAPFNFIHEQQSFMRLQGEQQSYSAINFGLFVCMIALAVLVLSSSSQTIVDNKSRALMQIPQAQEHPIAIIQSNNTKNNSIANISNDFKQNNINATAIVRVQHGLIALNNDDCLNSLMLVQGAVQSPPRGSLRGYQQNINRASNYLIQQGILLCSAKSPKNYQANFNKIRSSLVRLYMLGSQVKEMITNTPFIMGVGGTSIKTNELYKVAAEIKEVSLVTDHNCLL